MTDKFSISEIEQFQKLKKRMRQLDSWSESLKVEMEKLRRQQGHESKERTEIEETLRTRFKQLEAASSLFSLSDVPDTALEIKETHYVTANKKELLLEKMMNDYKALNPEETAVPFRWMKSELETRYEIKTRSVSNFFTGILDKYELVGGSRNRAVSLEEKK
jgi:hypothetical protein